MSGPMAWLSLNDVLERVPLSRNTVYSALIDGSLAGRKIGNKWIVSEAALEDWLAPATDNGTEPKSGAAGESNEISYLAWEEVSG